MASLTTQSSGLRIVQFMAPSGKRCSIRLGRIPLKDAKAFKGKIEQLVASRISGTAVDNDVAQWMSGLPSKYYAKLESFGLANARVQVEVPTLSNFTAQYIAERTDVKPATLGLYRIAERNLLEFFDGSRTLDSFTADDGDRFERFLREKGYAPASISRWIKFAKQFFRAAVRKELIAKNPFEDLKAGSQSNAARAYEVPRSTIDKVLEQCPDDQWKLIIILSRYAGLRCPSEVLRLTWHDVLWDERKMVVHASKTEHLADGGVRVVPIFPEVHPVLDRVYLEAEPGDYVITKYRGAARNFRNQLTRMIKRAGFAPWPRVFHNMRATRQTELENQYPSHVVCAWMGNSPRVAREHYLQVTDEHFVRASKASKSDAVPSETERNRPELTSMSFDNSRESL